MISASLRRAYRATRYQVVTENAILTVRIGETSPALDRLLFGLGVSGGAIITAWNPRSTRATLEENQARMAALLEDLRRAGWDFLTETAVADDPQWTEEGVFVLGISDDRAYQLGEAYQQNAIVLVNLGMPARLFEIPWESA